MRGNPILLIVIFYSLFIFLGESRSSSSTQSNNDDQVYIVYMGAAGSANGTLRKDHAHLLNTILRKNKKALIHNYKHGFSGFAARMSKNEANLIAQEPGVVSVFPDHIMKLHTTRSWDFLKSLSHIEIDNNLSESSPSSDIIIGMLDTGIWPEAASFSDKGMGPIPSGWKGVCMTSTDFNSSNCNRKIIGARYYPNIHDDAGATNTVRDAIGHGTHTASTAAGKNVSGASYYGLAKGTAIGGSPESRLAIYKVCYGDDCYDSAILAAFDDAIHDGVHVLSLSLGWDSDRRPALTNDSIAIGAFHAVEHGIMVVCAGGNDGPQKTTVVNDVPWIFTVGATTIDRDFLSNVVLGNNKVIKGRAINFRKSANYPLITGEAAKTSSADIAEARQCHFNSLDKEKAKEKIVLCDGRTDHHSTYSKVDVVAEVGGLGLVHITDSEGAEATYYNDFPATAVTSKDAIPILEYVNSTSNPVATILSSISVIDSKPAPIVAKFSSRGPSTLSKNILKPDIAAPGVDILAAWMGNDTTQAPKGKKPPIYNLASGTSMACPHVSGLAGSIKSRNPTWSASAIRSAIMTSATQFNNMKTPITTELGPVSTPYGYGAGEITMNASFHPGLVYETDTIDYLNYLCYLGYDTATIKLIAKTIPDGFSCPKDSTPDHISNINYPSIAISNFIGKEFVNVTRTVTNVGEEYETVYSAVIDAPNGVKVQLIPEKLQFTKHSKKQSYQVIFSSTLTSLKDDLFGSITWDDGKHKVRSPFVLAV
ncbi:unnamed protein product [Lathyrus sativus]|nr:unnamed protein product [Lathyrus sativus]